MSVRAASEQAFARPAGPRASFLPEPPALRSVLP
jgi:hypothetical protein